MVQTPQHDLDETFWRKRILPEEDRRSRPIPPSVERQLSLVPVTQHC